MGDGPVQPLYLNLEEVTQLEIAVGLLYRLSQHMVTPEAQALASLIIEWKEGQGAVSHLDQTLAHARDRVPVLRSVITALAELAESLKRVTPCGAVLHYDEPEAEYSCTLFQHPAEHNHECWRDDELVAEWAS